jgi:hypothetical protein
MDTSGETSHAKVYPRTLPPRIIGPLNRRQLYTNRFIFSKRKKKQILFCFRECFRVTSKIVWENKPDTRILFSISLGCVLQVRLPWPCQHSTIGFWALWSTTSERSYIWWRFSRGKETFSLKLYQHFEMVVSACSKCVPLFFLLYLGWRWPRVEHANQSFAWSDKS